MLHRNTLYTFLSTLIIIGKCNTDPSTCVSDCFLVADGDYTPCENYGCNTYLTCEDGKRSNPLQVCVGGQIWNPTTKQCDSPNDIKTHCADEENICCTGNIRNIRMSVAVKPGECVDDCTNVPNGDYQSCHCCDSYIHCNNGARSHKPCGTYGFVWDDSINKKRCDFTSDTCDNKDKCGTNEGVQFYEQNNDHDLYQSMEVSIISMWLILALVLIVNVAILCWCMKRNKRPIVYQIRDEEEASIIN